MSVSMKFARSFVFALTAIALCTTALLASGWEDDSCTQNETWNGQECELFWCVNEGSAYYICEDQIATHKDCPDDDCEEIPN